jgi:tRNA(fMet)-specific endonuclease VapC
MKYLLDTNICIYLIRQRPTQVLARFLNLRPGDVGVSSVTVAELEYGVAKSARPEHNRQALEGFLLPLEILLFDPGAAWVYGRIRATLESQGTPIGALNLLIAAHALSLGITLVSNNVREFQRISGLVLENWV